MRSLSEISYEIEHDIVALSKMIIELRDKHGDKLLPWMESLREQGLEDYEIVMQLVHAHGGME
jgi:hypothetical protein